MEEESFIEYYPDNCDNLELLIFVNGSIPSNSSPEWTPSYKLFNFLVEGVGVTTMTIFGVLGNMTSVIVLYQPKMRTSVSLLLMCLACFDTLLLLTNFLTFGVRGLFYYFLGQVAGDEFAALYNLPYWQYLHPLYGFATIGSVYFTVAIAIDRYIAVWWPLQSRYLCTWPRARYVAAAVILLSAGYNFMTHLTCYLSEIPLELRNNTNTSVPESNLSMDGSNNQTFPNRCSSFEGAMTLQYLIPMVFLPLTLLVVFNTLVYVKLQQENKKRKLMTSQERTETLFTVICVMVVTLFGFCNTALVVNSFLRYFYNCTYQQWQPIVDTIDNFLVSVNSSCNFIIYCAVGTRFRRQLRALLCCHKTVSLDDMASSTVQTESRTKQTELTNFGCTKIK
ncbi:unnamed protein product [Allacma fusca]|uniref:G-protein coupled receptors family 1 profile domain-containing protein n=1 Tax=Allacma fusca TaxID=39272 RepID=A0A8J2PIN4_9HEXA|nr:unnamed protein product [Allacma fusca]